MTKMVMWTKIILESFLEESGINARVSLDDEKAKILEGIMRTRFAGWSRQKQAEKFNLSIDTIDKYISELKHLYKETQKHSLILPTMKKSKKELDLDKKI